MGSGYVTVGSGARLGWVEYYIIYLMDCYGEYYNGMGLEMGRMEVVDGIIGEGWEMVVDIK